MNDKLLKAANEKFDYISNLKEHRDSVKIVLENDKAIPQLRLAGVYKVNTENTCNDPRKLLIHLTHPEEFMQVYMMRLDRMIEIEEKAFAEM